MALYRLYDNADKIAQDEACTESFRTIPLMCLVGGGGEGGH